MHLPRFRFSGVVMEGIVAIEGALMCENGLIEDTASAFFSEMHGHQVRNCWLPSTQGFLAYFTFARHRDAAHLRAEFCGRDTILRPEHDPDRGRWLQLPRFSRHPFSGQMDKMHCFEKKY